MASKGFLTLVDGVTRYRRGDHYERMAKGLLRSIRQQSREFPIAVITDSQNSELCALADQIIRPNREHGTGTIQKLYLDYYTPFAETLFIEADCLLYASAQEVWDFMAQAPFAVQRQGGAKFTPDTTNFSIKDVERYLKICQLPYIYHTIGGLIYFTQAAAAQQVFATARSLYERRQELGLKRLSTQIEVADETLFATAVELHKIGTLAVHNTLAQEEFRKLQRSSYAKVDVLRPQPLHSNLAGDARVLIVHYSATAKFRWFYLRELQRLKLVASLPRQLTKSRWLLDLLAGITSLAALFTLKHRWWGFRLHRAKSIYQEQGLGGIIRRLLRAKAI